MTEHERDISHSSVERIVFSDSCTLLDYMFGLLTRLRAEALSYLRRSRAPAEQVVPLALKFLHSADGYDRWLAASLLGDYVKVDEVRAALEKVRDDPDSRVRDAAARALKP